MNLHYYLFSVSKNRAQLFEVQGDNIHPITVEGLPSGIDAAWAGMERHEQSVQSHSTGGGTVGYHGQGGATEIEEQEEDRYMRMLANSVHTLVHEHHLPLVFAGVQEEFGMFRKFDTSRHLIDEYIQGSPDHSSMEDLKAKADPIVEAHMLKRNAAFVEEYGNLLGTGRTSTDMTAILDAATQGKVDLLLIGHDHEADAAEAATHTLKHRGRVAVVEEGSIPENAQIAAILRY